MSYSGFSPCSPSLSLNCLLRRERWICSGFSAVYCTAKIINELKLLPPKQGIKGNITAAFCQQLTNKQYKFSHRSNRQPKKFYITPYHANLWAKRQNGSISNSPRLLQKMDNFQFASLHVLIVTTCYSLPRASTKS